MEAYTIFSEIYDDFMDEIPYDEWCDAIEMGLHANDINKGIIAELGCGTGVVTRALLQRGYDMIGIDFSEDMLAIAREETDPSVLYLHQDMREFELFGTVDAFVSVCDSMNYLCTREDFVKVLKRVNLYLERKGIFFFDLKTPYFYKNVLGDSVQFDHRDYAALIWENHYDEDNRLHTYDLTMFLAEEETNKEDVMYEKFSETHYQRAYQINEVEEMVREAGMEFVSCCDAKTHGKVTALTERVHIIARECFQKDKYYEEK